MKLVLAAILAAATPSSDSQPVIVRDLIPSGGDQSSGYRAEHVCSPYACEIDAPGDWKITTATGSFIVHGGFYAETGFSR